ncbi:LOW QUALITY PROTEIN: cytokine-like protein 1 [Phyllostomus hastatus]|uniref:LOW QUALITY PROTEIN: cytokine-like protein 1 n=1 Tax=Phyllostomus hastatus TaxID=9423 RepID=UPI001E685106|nr:LOW QUALITY PROTEIN: cytokine-like protein 1 [Phyllostomus hastatus]
MEAWRTTPKQPLKGAAAWGCRRTLCTMTPWLLPLLLLLLAGPPAVWPAPPTCYSRMLGLSRQITRDFQSLQATEPSEPCVRYLPKLYLDIHNYCVLAKLRDFVATPQCWRVAQVDALKERVRKLYTIMNSFCRRDLVFLTDDCGALEYPMPATTALPDHHG